MLCEDGVWLWVVRFHSGFLQKHIGSKGVPFAQSKYTTDNRTVLEELLTCSDKYELFVKKIQLARTVCC